MWVEQLKMITGVGKKSNQMFLQLDDRTPVYCSLSERRLLGRKIKKISGVDWASDWLKILLGP